MVSRRGLTDIALNAVIALVLVGITFAVGFFIYSSVIESLTTTQVTKGFESFISPIKEVCQGKSSSLGFDINLPTTGEYTYGIFQTKLNPSVGYSPNMPLLMKKCEGSYCLCLFRIKNGARNEFWNDSNKGIFNSPIMTSLLGLLNVNMPSSSDSGPTSASPLWHFNSAGLRILPSLITRILQFYVMRLIKTLIIDWVLPHVIKSLITTFICTMGTAGTGYAACWLIANVVLYVALTALTDGALTALIAFYEQLTDAFLLVNYPNNFMSVSNIDYLYWSNSYDSTGYGTDSYIPEMATSVITTDDLKAIRAAFREGAVRGAIDGLFKGITAGVSGKGAKQMGKLAKSLTKIGQAAAETYSYIYVKGAQKDFGIHATQFDLPENLRPQAYVRTLLSLRRVMDLNEFITMSSSDWLNGLLDFFSKGLSFLFGFTQEYADAPVAPDYIYSIDTNVTSFNNLDIINCVGVSELGPYCNGSTPVLMDYDHDMFLSYRITDPINFPAKAVFCAYDAQKANLDVNIIDSLTNSLSKSANDSLQSVPEVQGAVSEVINFLGSVANLIIGDWLLAGQQRLTGLLMECVETHFNIDYKSEYFQYWIPYHDYTGYTNTDNEIGVISATLTKMDSNQPTCEANILSKWQACLDSFFASTTVLNNHGIYCATDLPETDPLLGGSLFDTIEDVLSCDWSVFELQKLEFYSNTGTYARYSNYKFNLCPYDGLSNNCNDLNTAAYETSLAENSITCKELFQPQYLRCKPGIHVSFYGVTQ